MDDELTPEQKFNAEDPETMVPRALSRGRSREDIIADLVRLDWTPEAAASLVDRVINDLAKYHHSPEARRDLRRGAVGQMASGALLLFCGAAITAVTLIAATLFGGAYLIAGGTILFGGILLGRGWARWTVYRHDSLPFDDARQPREEI